MKIPLTWLKDYVKTDKSPREISASFTQLGLMLDKPLDDSDVIDLEHRMDRSDWLSIMGCARDYAAFESLKLKYPITNTRELPRVNPSEMIEVSVKTPHVRRFNTRLVKNVVVGNSPDWLIKRLNAYGIKSINNVVDITNFVMVELGQPMHAQDTSKLKKREITLRDAKKDETIKTILGTKVALDPSIFVLSSGGEATVIGGIVGGETTSVTSSTTEIILDAGNYDQSVIRKNSRKLKIINETVSRYDKFLHPDLCEMALDRATYLLEEYAGATVYYNFDYYPKPPVPKSMTFTHKRLRALSGMDIKTSDIKRILTALEYVITQETGDGLVLAIPSFRTDVLVEDDIVADILRIYDYSSIPTSPLTTPVPTDITPNILLFEDKLRDLLVSQGAHEHITVSLVKESGEAGEIKLSNALSTDQNALRLSALPKLQDVRSNYAKHKINNVTVFEIGKTFSQKSGKYLEHRTLSVVGQSDMRVSLATLMHQLGIDYAINNNHEIIIKDKVCGIIATNSYSLSTDLLNQHHRQYVGIVSDFGHSTKRDISLLAPAGVSYYDIASVMGSLNIPVSVSVKEITKRNQQTNYLLTLKWDRDNISPEQDIQAITQKLKEDLDVTSSS